MKTIINLIIINYIIELIQKRYLNKTNRVKQIMIKFKVVVAGAKNVGKTSLIRRYATGKFETSTLSTIGVDFETKKVIVDGTEILLNI